ncbi:MAG TPA: DNA methyltransferase [Tepidisphaeraceae bacterium]|jgi:DNA modification methylase|nr:DNA methyltransferase [Tepidisphaeraceae bacterium]
MNVDIYNLDCIAGMRDKLADESVHLTVTSIPFEELFTYSGKLEDVGNNGSTIDIRGGRFALNMRFVIGELFRVTAPGCNVCIHIQQLLAYKNQHGFAGRRDFRGAIIDLFRAGGFTFHADVAHPAVDEAVTADELTDLICAYGDDPKTLTAVLRWRLGAPLPAEFIIPKDPQAMAQRLSLHSLQFKTGHSRDSNNWAMAPNDYVLVFHKPGEAAVPVRPLVYKPHAKPTRREAFYQAEGRRDPMAYAEYLRKWARDVDAGNKTGWLSADDWIKWASGVWGDIDEFDIIDGARSQAQKRKLKEADEEKHVCPLQLEVIRRCVLLYSNPIDLQPDVTVLDPFMGVGSTAAVCVELNRSAVGFELKESYHANAIKNVERARTRPTDDNGGQMSLADLSTVLVERERAAVPA